MKFWNFVKNEADAVELRINGDIVDDDDAWIYEWFGIPAASPNAFRDELSQHVGKNISVWIDSYGGSVFAATGIYNALMEHKKTGATVSTIIDSKAMSAATIIFMAGDERKVTPGCIFMMHNPLAGTYGYASDLRKAADVLDVVKDSIINAYQLPTGLSRNRIASMMDDETYMSAKTAIKNRFATDMLYAENQDDQLESIMNFNFSRLAIQNAAHDSMKNFFAIAKKLSQKSPEMTKPNNPKNKEDTKVEINTVEELTSAYPELVNKIVNTAVQNALNKENERINGLDELDDPKNAAIHDIICDAKATGKSADDVKNVINIIKKHTPDTPAPENTPGKEGQDFMKKLLNDNKSSGVDGIKATGSSKEIDNTQKDAAAINFMAGIINKKNGRANK